MFGYGGGKVHHLGNIVARKRTDTLVHIIGSDLSPRKRTTEKFVSTKPGLMLVTRTGVSTRSMRNPSDNAFTAALLAQYTLPPG